MLTVNRSTTRYLKLMLLTLCEQRELARIGRVVICDNGSRDGGADFVRRLAARCPRVLAVVCGRGSSHARGMRAAIEALTADEARGARQAREAPSNLWLFCDTDVVFRNEETLRDLGTRIVESGAAAAGELRHGVYPVPEAQASFVAMRADWYHHPRIIPWVNHGAPSYWMQRSIWRAGGTILDFPSNHGGYILHRGRAAVANARTYDPLSSYATVANARPHFMGVAGGAEIWAEVEGRNARWLEEEREGELIALLADRLR